MRTTLDIDAKLLREAMTRSKTKTKTETIERGLQELIQAEKRRGLLSLKGRGYGVSLKTFLRQRHDE